MSQRKSGMISKVPDPSGKFVVFKRSMTASRTKFTAAHDTLEQAQDEALRLALAQDSGDAQFYIARVMCSVKTIGGKIIAA